MANKLTLNQISKLLDSMVKTSGESGEADFDKATEYAEKYNQLKEADKSIG